MNESDAKVFFVLLRIPRVLPLVFTQAGNVCTRPLNLATDALWLAYALALFCLLLFRALPPGQAQQRAGGPLLIEFRIRSLQEPQAHSCTISEIEPISSPTTRPGHR